MSAARSGKVRGRLTIKEVNAFKQAPRELEIEVTADNAPVPIVYGSRSVPLMVSAYGYDAGGNFIARAAASAGEIFQFDAIFYNGKPLPASAEVRMYRGTSIQGVDDLVASITTIPSYSDNMVLLKPAGLFAAAYVVILLPPGAISESPKFQGIVRGRLVYDPRAADSTGDPFDSGNNLLVGYNLQFIGTNGSTPATGMDVSTHDHGTTWVGGANIQGNVAEMDGNGDYIVVQDDTNADFGSGRWTIELAIQPDVVTGTHYIFGKGDSASDRSIQVYQSNDDLRVNMSSNGTSWGIASAITFATNVLAVDTPVKITIEFTAREYHFYVDGVHAYRIASTASLYATTGPAWLGLADGISATNAFDGTYIAARLTKTVNRYGGVHTAIASPYADSDAMNPGYVYDNISAMCFTELAMNPFYGFGATVVNTLINSIDWNESLLGGAVERARLDLVISGVRPTDEWLDLLATYADCIWFFEGDGITLLPDRPVDAQNPSGWEMGDNMDFISHATDWTLGTGWTHNPATDSLDKAAGTAGQASQPLSKAFEVGETYIATLKLTTVTAGSARLELDGVPLIEYQTATGLHAYEFVATGTEDGGTIAAFADAAFVGTVKEASIKRKYWFERTLVAGSLRLAALSNSDSPTRVIVQHTTPSDTTPNWLEAEPAIFEVPGVDSGEVPLIETRMDMRGITRPEEAQNKAQSKLNRMQNRLRAEWTSADIGIAYHKGKVIDVYDPETAARLLVLLEGVSATTDAGRYRATGLLYSDLHYPSDLVLPGGAGIVPVGVLGLLKGSTVPGGWQLYNAANGKYIKGAGNTVAVGATGGASTHSALSGNTSTDGAHGTTEAKFESESFTARIGSGSGYIYDDTDELAGGHLHTYNTGTLTPDVYRRENVFVEKITTVGTFIPKEVMVFGLKDLSYPNMTRWLIGAQRLLMAATDSINAGNNNQTVAIGATGSTSDAHDHWTRPTISNGSPDTIGVTPPRYSPISAGGAHTHPATLALGLALKRIRMSLYVGTDDYSVGPGVCFFWKGSYASIDPDFTLCTGLLGTVDVEDYFIEISAMGEEETTAGDNTLGVTGYSNYSATHEHKGSYFTAYTHDTRQISHGENVKHRHFISNTGNAWQPDHYALAMIMYNPTPVTSFVDVALLVNGGEANGATNIVDRSNYALTETVEGAGALTYSNAQLLFGLTTLLNSGKRFKYPAFNYTKKFTFEGFFRNSSTGAMILFGNHVAADNNTFEVRKNASGDIDLYIGDTIQATIALGLTSGAWFYVGLCYDYAEWRIYAGMQSVGTAVRDTYIDAANSVTDDLYWLDGAGGVAAFAGHSAQLRVTRGAAILSGSVVAIPAVAFATA